MAAPAYAARGNGSGGAAGSTLSVPVPTGSADGSNYTVSLTASVYRSGRAVRITGVIATGDPWDFTDSGTQATGVNTPAVDGTTSVAETLLVWLASNFWGDNDSANYWTPPTGFTERYESDDASTFQVHTLATMEQASAGATGTVQGALDPTPGDGDDFASSAWLGALKPAPAGQPSSTVIVIGVYSEGALSATPATGFTHATNSPVINSTVGSAHRLNVIWKRLPPVAVNAVAATATVPAPALSTGSTKSAATIAAAVTVPAPAISTGVTVSPATIAATAAFPAATPGAGSTVSPSAVTAVVTLPAPTVSAGGSVQITPAAIAATAALPVPSLSTGSTVSAATITAVVTLPAATAGAGSTVSPSVIAATVGVPAASLVDPAGSMAPNTVTAPTVRPAHSDYPAALGNETTGATVRPNDSRYPAMAAGSTAGPTMRGA